MHVDGRHILTDTYTMESPAAFGDGTIPLRWIDLGDGAETTLVRINTRQPDDEGDYEHFNSSFVIRVLDGREVAGGATPMPSSPAGEQRRVNVGKPEVSHLRPDGFTL